MGVAGPSLSFVSAIRNYPSRGAALYVPRTSAACAHISTSQRNLLGQASDDSEADKLFRIAGCFIRGQAHMTLSSLLQLQVQPTRGCCWVAPNCFGLRSGVLALAILQVTQ